MHKRFKQLILHTTLCLSVVAVDSLYAHTNDIQKQIDALREQVLEVQQNTDSMRNELDDLKSNQQDWITEERAEDLRVLVKGLLDDADARSSLVGDGLLGGWSDGFFIASSDGRFRLNISGLVQERYIMSYQRVGPGFQWDRWRGGMENTRTRLNLSGHLFDKDLTFLYQPGFGYLDPNAISNSPLLRIGARYWDAWLKYRINDEWSAKLGVFTLPFTRESLVSDARQLAVDKSLMDYRIGLARSQGVQFTWHRDNMRVFMSTSNGGLTMRGNQAGSTNPTPPWAALGQDTDFSGTVRAEFLLKGQWNQFNQFTSPPGSEEAQMFGIAFHTQSEERLGLGGGKVDAVGITADLSMNYDGASFFASGTIHNIKNFTVSLENTDLFAYIVQGSKYVSDSTELFTRYEAGGLKQDFFGGPTIQILTSGANWYLEGQQFKITSDFGWSFGELSPVFVNQMLGWRGSPNRNAEWVFRTQLQVEF
ncbi:MAG: porin [Planctomycetota bacterium]|nr:porin [Planctomycetota bacterium]